MSQDQGAPGQPVLEAVGISFAYPGSQLALNDLSLTIRRGQRLAILGANGCGKTTLFLHLNGLLRPQHGSINLAGQAVRYDRAGLNELRRRVGLIFQDPDDQLFAPSVRQDISFGPLNLGWSDELVRAKVEQVIHDAQIEDLVDRPTHLLSHGQKKRVAIAGVLAMEPDVVVADEPTAGLDPEMSARLLDLFERIQAAGRTVVLSTHDVELALAWADRIVVLAHGQVLAEGDPAALLLDSTLTSRARLVQPIVLQAYQSLREVGLIDRERRLPRTAAELAELVVGRRLQDQAVPRE